MKNIVIKSLLSAAALSLTAGLSMNASAGQVDETYVHGYSAEAPSVTVSYTASELATEEGRVALEKRIESAAEQVCGPMDYHRAGGLSGISKSKACYKDAVAEAMDQLSPEQVAVLTR